MVRIIEMVIISIISNFTVNFHIEQDIKKYIKQKWTHHKALRYTTINGRPIATFTHDFDALTSVFEITND